MKLIRKEEYTFELPKTTSEVKDAIKFLNKELHKMYHLDPHENINWWRIEFNGIEFYENSSKFHVTVYLYKIELFKGWT